MNVMELAGTSYDLRKFILEIRYEDSLYFYDLAKMYNLKKKLKTDYPRSQKIDSGVVLINHEEERQLQIFEDRASVIDDNPRSLSNFKSQAIEIVGHVSSILEIKEYLRVGLRVFIGKRNNSLLEVASKVKAKMSSFNEIFDTAQENNNLNISLTYTDNDNHGVIINITPETMLKVKNTGMEIQHSDYNHLVFDFDLYTTTSTDPNSLNGFLNNSISKIEKLLQGLEKWF